MSFIKTIGRSFLPYVDKSTNMIFHITATHNYETCPAHNEEIRQTFAKTLMGSEEKQVKVISTYVNAPAHTFYIIIEAEAIENIYQWLDPIITHNHYDIEPVADMMAALNNTNQ